MGTWRSEAHDQVGEEEPPEGGRPATPGMESTLCTFKKKWTLQNKRRRISIKRKKGLGRPHRKSCPRNRHTHALAPTAQAWCLGAWVIRGWDYRPVGLLMWRCWRFHTCAVKLLAPPPGLTSSFFSPRLSTFTAPKDVHTRSSCSGKQMKPRKTLIFQKLWPGWEPASSVPGEDNGEGD